MAEGKRKLAAIMSADVVGYSRLMADDEGATVTTLHEYRSAIARVVERHGGRVVNAPGDNILAEFPSAVEAVVAAREIQQVLKGRNLELAADRRMDFRVGVNLGDVIEQLDGSIYGNGVNIAARMEALAEPGGICIASSIYDAIEGKLDFGFEFLGAQHVKNIAKPVNVYRVRADAEAPTTLETAQRPLWVPWAAVATLVIGLVATPLWLNRDRSAPTPDESLSAEPVTVAITGQPSIAVLPFDNLSGDSGQEYFADGLTDEIIGAIARFPEFAVIARSSTFRYKGQALDVRLVGRELGAGYLVEGSVRRVADHVRVTAQLIETETGSHLWNETYDESLTPATMFAIQDDIATSVATTVGGFFGVLSQKGFKVARRKPPENLSSYDCVLLSMEYIRVLSIDAHAAALDCLERAVENDPDYARAWAELSAMQTEEYIMGYNPRPGTPALDRGLIAAQRAVALAPNEIRGHVVLAKSHFWRDELDAFKSEVAYVVDAPSRTPAALGELGLWLCYSGDWGQGLALIEKAKAFDPFFPKWAHAASFWDYYRKGEYEQALAEALKHNAPGLIWAQAALAAAYGQLDQAGEAAPYVARILALDPSFETTARADRQKWFRHQEDLLDHFMAGLRKAGLNIAQPPTASRD